MLLGPTLDRLINNRINIRNSSRIPINSNNILISSNNNSTTKVDPALHKHRQGCPNRCSSLLLNTNTNANRKHNRNPQEAILLAHKELVR